MGLNYANVLAKAVQAARDAGDMLRRELHRPGGPRGESGHAPVDAEVEAMIRARLSAAYPGWGLVGEELGGQNTSPKDLQRHVWLIDPNDGTWGFVKGHRGSSVSIALMRGPQPVLGVVYAFAFPDDEGDLFAWAEGCGVPQRNGQPLARQSWATKWEPQHTVLLHHGSENVTQAYAGLVAPARIRRQVSIAYRLALAAAGEAELAASLQGPVAWDVAAGHALLRGVGGEVFNSNGEVLQYDEGNWLRSANVFGGSPLLAPAMARLNWANAAATAPAEPGTPLTLCGPRPGHLAADSQVLRRAQGCWLGQLAGDSLGALVEFKSSHEIQNAYPGGLRVLEDGGVWGLLAGQPTDDSELALMLARSLVDKGKYDPEAAAAAYAWWLETKPFDVGTTTRQALSAGAQALHNRRPVAEACRCAANPASQANGALMRIAPLGIFGHRLPVGEVAELARADARLTHPHPVCQDANAVFVVALAQAIATGAPPGEIHAFSCRWARENRCQAAVIQALDEALTTLPTGMDGHQQGWVLLALQNAFYQASHANSVVSGLANTIAQGGDTDTNACIAGALLGALHGRSSIPPQWLDRILCCRPLEGLPRVRKPRPKPFWPVDALLLSERLLAGNG